MEFCYKNRIWSTNKQILIAGFSINGHWLLFTKGRENLFKKYGLTCKPTRIRNVEFDYTNGVCSVKNFQIEAENLVIDVSKVIIGESEEEINFKCEEALRQLGDYDYIA